MSPEAVEVGLGIIAGGGVLPVQLAEACRARGRPHTVIALEGQADPTAYPGSPVARLRLGALGAALARFKADGIGEVVMAGPVRRPSLAELRPDLEGVRFLARHALKLKALGDDGLLRVLIAEFEGRGFKVVGAAQVLADLLAPPGVWTTRKPDPQDSADITRAAAVLDALGPLDVGQACVVQQGLVLGVEAIEGTAALLERCAGLRRAGGGGVLVKLAKPGQESRVDLPTIGPDTVAQAARAGLAGVAVEAGRALALERPRLIAEAEAAGLFLLGWERP
ncbi:LpxI family protein [Roseospirillum parvum]|uniref:UDP-2,3-diacylglucosamine pyrophosphatase n=1 Tax=Roseospirillum parvum TaxID=83401 RepID=A0A1G7Y3U0_9PROT|nr:UDP-2,3-diacylglucosamine diphosphatase LpxI [Roseospirillum parvum]SDG90916.1 hypothetical protein SAMN05421742_103176 [Roseospirillum parvum]